ncbi:MAG: (d)CMP kinase [Lachnospiraceae bacterium]|nr:(d)CMP kinase [Lachnospiraceae bacterium]
MGFTMAIDGPAGAGKSTIAKLVGEKLGLIYIDTGAMYRAVACYFVENNINPDDGEEVKKACDSIVITIDYYDGVQQVILNDRNVTPFLRGEETGKMASRVAKLGAVRSKLVSLQRDMADNGRIIMDGRDIGTCVFPGADIKIYLTASSAVRAKRRYDELVSKGVACNIDEIEKDIINRDYEDMHREISPLKKADDAICIDTSGMGISEVVDKLIEIYEEKNS